MAKIINMKSKEVLADLPTEYKTSRTVEGFITSDNKLAIIAHSPGNAETLLLTIRIDCHKLNKKTYREFLYGF